MQHVLETACNLFWEKGYEATSTRDLSESTSLTPSSIYAAFGDKHGLFLAALEYYLLRLKEKMARLENTAEPDLAITLFFADTINKTLSDPLLRGCLLVNSSLEVSPSDTAIRAAISRELAEIEDFFRRCYAAARKTDNPSRDISPVEAAQQLLTARLGIRVRERARPDETLLCGAVEQTLGPLGLPELAPYLLYPTARSPSFRMPVDES